MIVVWLFRYESTLISLTFQDFSKFYTEEGKISDLILVVYFLNNQGTIEWKYLDHLSTEKQDFYFVCAVWHSALDGTLKKYKQINVWSDGGPAHFKIAKTLYFFSTLEAIYGKKFQYNFFASSHGHSLCDSHTGKQFINPLKA